MSGEWEKPGPDIVKSSEPVSPSNRVETHSAKQTRGPNAAYDEPVSESNRPPQRPMGRGHGF